MAPPPPPPVLPIPPPTTSTVAFLLSSAPIGCHRSLLFLLPLLQFFTGLAVTICSPLLAVAVSPLPNHLPHIYVFSIPPLCLPSISSSEDARSTATPTSHLALSKLHNRQVLDVALSRPFSIDHPSLTTLRARARASRSSNLRRTATLQLPQLPTRSRIRPTALRPRPRRHLSLRTLPRSNHLSRLLRSSPHCSPKRTST